MTSATEFVRLLNLAEHLLAPCSFNSVGEGVEHTQEMRDELRQEIEAALISHGAQCLKRPALPRLELTEKPLGEGPRLYAVVVYGPLNKMPTLWKVLAYDEAAAEAFAAKAAGYDEDSVEEAFADSLLIGTVLQP